MPALDKIMAAAPVIAVVTIDDAAAAVPLARALVAGGVPAVEITLRTPAALEAVRRVAGEVEGAITGAGTVLCAADAEAAQKAGAQFLVSPGLTETLAKAARDSAAPLLPGVATASELMRGLELGFTAFKLFPAEAAGGVALLKSLGGPLPQARFCPTGGITFETAPAYLALPNVACVGGSWLAPKAAVAAADWAAIERLARAAASLSR